MVEAIATKLEDVRSLCQKHGVVRLWLFGSAVKPGVRFDADSDFDFLVEFDRKHVPLRGFSDPFWQLLMDLEEVLGRRIDLVELRPFKDPHFAAELEHTRQLIYETAPAQTPL